MITLLLILYVVICVSLGLILMIDVVNKKLVAAICYCLFLVIIMAALFEATGTSRDIRTEWRSIKDATLISWQFDEPNAIYLWVSLDNKPPRNYILPWNIKTAEQIRKAGEEAKGNDRAGTVRFSMGLPGFLNSGLDTEPMFWAPPQPGRPPKNIAPPATVGPNLPGPIGEPMPW